VSWLERYRTPILVTLLTAIVIGIGVLIARQWGEEGFIEIVLPSPTAQPDLVVYISGEVLRPGLYTLPPGARIADLVEMAGGLSPEADGARINLAARVQDGQQIDVPLLGEAAAAPTAVPPVPGSAVLSRINVNLATAQELEQLPGIGPARAQAIIAYREQHGPFASVEELLKVDGIGPTTLERIRDLVTVR
jgi:competence protein ComEA